MSIRCFICDVTSRNGQNNLAQIKSQHSGYPLLIFIKKFLRTFTSNRDITDPRNHICEKCLKRVNEYDELCVKAKIIEDELYKLLVKSDKSRECTQEAQNTDRKCRNESRELNGGQCESRINNDSKIKITDNQMYHRIYCDSI